MPIGSHNSRFRGNSYAYCPYGFLAQKGARVGFNGERPDPLLDAYFLGNGFRVYSLVLMRFLSPDRFSPFGKGGRNGYAYALGDPINHIDPSGAITQRVAHAINLKWGRQLFDAGKHAPFYGVRLRPGVDPYKLSVLHSEGHYGDVINNLELGAIGEYVERFPAIKMKVVMEATKNALSLIESSPNIRDLTDSGPPGLLVQDWKNIEEGVLLASLRKNLSSAASPRSRIEPRAQLTEAVHKLPSAKLRIVQQLKRRMKAIREGRAVSKDDWISAWVNRD